MITTLKELNPQITDNAFINCDCMEGLKKFPDNYFDLAVVDPPYGDGGVTSREIQGLVDGSTAINRGGQDRCGSMVGIVGTSTSRHRQHKNCRKPDGTWGYPNWGNMGGEIQKKIITWDVAPKQEYFDELFRVSRHQIIWGGNYFYLPPTRCFLIWRKLTISESFSMAMAEYAWTSFNANAKVFECAPQDNTGLRFHPTQKPLKLYEWIMQNYAKDGDVILDTHCGSAGSLIAAYRTQHRFVGFEIDSEYYQKAKERLVTEMSQMTIFDFME